MTTCFGQRVTILRSIRAIIYMFLLCISISLKHNGIPFYIVCIWLLYPAMLKSIAIHET